MDKYHEFSKENAIILFSALTISVLKPKKLREKTITFAPGIRLFIKNSTLKAQQFCILTLPHHLCDERLKGSHCIYYTLETLQMRQQ